MRRLIRLLALTVMIGPLFAGVAPIAAQEIPPPLTDRFELPAADRILSLSPDGTMVVALANGSDSLCTVSVPDGEEIACADLTERRIRLREDDIAWAPDSSGVAFAEETLTQFVDGDLWLMNAATGELTDLTDDGYEGDLPFFGLNEIEQEIYADVLPTWSPDGATIAFSRAVFSPDLPDPSSELWLIDVATGETTKLAVVADDEFGAIYATMAWSPDGGTIYASINQSAAENPEDGIWAFDAATGEGKQLIGPLPDLENSVPAVLSVSPAGDVMTVFDPYLASSMVAEVSGYGLLSLDDGSYTPIEPPDDLTTADGGVVSSPTIAPDGRTLLYNLRRFEDPIGLLIARDLATGEDQPVATLPEGEIPFPVDRGLPITVAPDGLIFIPTEFAAGYLVTLPSVYLGSDRETDPVEELDEPLGTPIPGALTPFAPEDAARIFAYSPDGSMVVGTPELGPTALCTYAVPSGDTITCADLQAAGISLEITDISWSPDSTMVAFGERPYMTFRDGDLWTMDARSGELINRTDDGYEGVVPFLDEPEEDGPVDVDVLPRWSPDSSAIAFSRSTVTGPDDPTSSELWTLDLATGESRPIARVAEDEIGVLYFNLAWAPDGDTIYATVMHRETHHPENGIWAYDVESGEGEQIVAAGELFGGAAPAVMAVSPDNDYLSIYYPELIAQFAFEEGGYALFDLERGEIVELPVPEALESETPVLTLMPGFTPDGASVIYGVRRYESPVGSIVRLDLASGEADIIAELPDDARPIPASLFEGIRTAANGSAFVLTSINSGYLVPVPVPGAEAPPATPDNAGGTPGAATVTASEAAIYAAPSFDAPVVLTLSQGAEVEIIGEPVSNDEGVWVPVRDPETRTIGYLPEEAFSSQSGDNNGE
jgi:Tol biopolymer transport system component